MNKLHFSEVGKTVCDICRHHSQLGRSNIIRLKDNKLIGWIEALVRPGGTGSNQGLLALMHLGVFLHTHPNAKSDGIH